MKCSFNLLHSEINKYNNQKDIKWGNGFTETLPVQHVIQTSTKAAERSRKYPSCAYNYLDQLTLTFDLDSPKVNHL